MRLIIEQDGVKRQLEGAFYICGDRKDILALVQQLQAHLADETWSFGWTTIYPQTPGRSANLPVKSWSA